jgi:hypothetical protein
MARNLALLLTIDSVPSSENGSDHFACTLHNQEEQIANSPVGNWQGRDRG